MAAESCSVVLTSTSVIVIPSKAVVGGAGGSKSTAIADGINACQAGCSGMGALHTS
jgi:hypothetical protein